MTRTLYLLRHAKAEAHSLFKSDFDRVLAEQGREDALKLGEWMATGRCEPVGEPAMSGAPCEITHNNIDFKRMSCPAGQQIFTGASTFIWCSSAARTRETLEYVKQGYAEQGANWQAELQVEKKLYHASAETMLSVLRLTPPDAQRVLMVGHNPGISELAAALAGRGEAKLIDDIKLGMPTCALAIFEFDCTSWQEAGPTNSEIKGFWVGGR